MQFYCRHFYSWWTLEMVWSSGEVKNISLSISCFLIFRDESKPTGDESFSLFNAILLWLFMCDSRGLCDTCVTCVTSHSPYLKGIFQDRSRRNWEAPKRVDKVQFEGSKKKEDFWIFLTKFTWRNLTLFSCRNLCVKLFDSLIIFNECCYTPYWSLFQKGEPVAIRRLWLRP